jgi:hypothetical protein
MVYWQSISAVAGHLLHKPHCIDMSWQSCAAVLYCNIYGLKAVGQCLYAGGVLLSAEATCLYLLLLLLPPPLIL